MRGWKDWIGRRLQHPVETKDMKANQPIRATCSPHVVVVSKLIISVFSFW